MSQQNIKHMLSLKVQAYKHLNLKALILSIKKSLLVMKIASYVLTEYDKQILKGW